MKFSVLTILLGVVLLVSCGPGAVSVTVYPKGNEMAYSTTEFTVKAGQKVTLIMENTATSEVMKHNVVILNDESAAQAVGTAALSAPNYLPEHPAIIAATPMADAGATSQVEFTAPSNPGTYLYFCTYPGHYMMMRGKMIVQ